MVVRLDVCVVVQRSVIIDFFGLDFLYGMLHLLPKVEECLEEKKKSERVYVFGKKGNQ
jgi:hypothetical protein